VDHDYLLRFEMFLSDSKVVFQHLYFVRYIPPVVFHRLNSIRGIPSLKFHPLLYPTTYFLSVVFHQFIFPSV
jgi:hypothetical protein